ncbi:golgin subfamily A member 6-like protein 25 [Macrobrachium rosenbergii]|uniref:golgin subfamily A member 6-like protein 25 n=1 Tax=Macrobrachium rosenbergii TaxID=79674 RepID=UPI0034D46E04
MCNHHCLRFSDMCTCCPSALPTHRSRTLDPFHDIATEACHQTIGGTRPLTQKHPTSNGKWRGVSGNREKSGKEEISTKEEEEEEEEGGEEEEQQQQQQQQDQPEKEDLRRYKGKRGDKSREAGDPLRPQDREKAAKEVHRTWWHNMICPKWSARRCSMGNLAVWIEGYEGHITKGVMQQQAWQDRVPSLEAETLFLKKENDKEKREKQQLEDKILKITEEIQQQMDNAKEIAQRKDALCEKIKDLTAQLAEANCQLQRHEKLLQQKEKDLRLKTEEAAR